MIVELVMDNVVCVGKKENKVNNNLYYSITVVQNNEAGSLSCGEDVYNTVIPFHPYRMICVYKDGQYKNLRVVHVVEVESSENWSLLPPAPISPSEPITAMPTGEQDNESNATGGKNSQSTATKKGK